MKNEICRLVYTCILVGKYDNTRELIYIMTLEYYHLKILFTLTLYHLQYRYTCITITHYMLHDDGRYVMSVWTRPNQQYRVHVLPAFIWRRSRRFSLPIASVYMSNHSPHSFSPSQFCPTSDMFSNILELIFLHSNLSAINISR